MPSRKSSRTARGRSPERRRAFAGRVIAVDVERVELPNGALADLEIIRHPGGAAAVAINAAREVCLLRQYRYALGGWLWELPAGKLDGGEQPLRAARRELAEEAGVTAARWTPLGEFVSSPGVFTEVVHLFLATRLATGSGIMGAARKPQYAVAPDGRFLMNVVVEGGTPSPITVVLNWMTGLRQ